LRPSNITALIAILLILGGYLYLTSMPVPPPKEDPQLFVWLIEMEEIQHIVINLPREGKSQSFIKEEDRSWHFDDAERSPVDMQRWGGGIPLLLSGPSTNRLISANTSEEKLIEFGLMEPLMEVTLTLENDEVLAIKVGDNTPNSTNHYVQAPGSTDVALVDYTWYNEIARLVREPPYISTPD